MNSVGSADYCMCFACAFVGSGVGQWQSNAFRAHIGFHYVTEV